MKSSVIVFPGSNCDRDIAVALDKFNIKSRLVYPPLNTLKIFNIKGNFKNSNYFCKRGLWLPSSINLTKKDLRFIINTIKNYFKINE